MNNDIDIFGGMDKPDFRDYRAEEMDMFGSSDETTYKEPARVDLFNSYVKDQKRTNHCSSYGGAMAFQMALIRKYKDKLIEVDAEQYWKDQMKYPATGSEEKGDYLYAPCKSAVKNGVLVKINGVKQRVYAKGYARVSKPNIQSMIAQGHTLLTGAKIMSPFTTEIDGDFIYNPDGGKYRGGHLFCLTGYDDKHYFAVNSWGDKWGKKGEFKIRKDQAIFLMSSFVIYF